MNARTLDYRGRIVESGWLARSTRQQLEDLAEQFPVGSRIVHVGGRRGTVALDQPQHVPGLFSGAPAAVCLGGPYGDEPMVFATWDNACDIVWRVWVPVFKVRAGRAPAVNRPGNKARIGGRR